MHPMYTSSFPIARLDRVTDQAEGCGEMRTTESPTHHQLSIRRSGEENVYLEQRASLTFWFWSVEGVRVA